MRNKIPNILTGSKIRVLDNRSPFFLREGIVVGRSLGFLYRVELSIPLDDGSSRKIKTKIPYSKLEVIEPHKFLPISKSKLIHVSVFLDDTRMHSNQEEFSCIDVPDNKVCSDISYLNKHHEVVSIPRKKLAQIDVDKDFETITFKAEAWCFEEDVEAVKSKMEKELSLFCQVIA